MDLSLGAVGDLENSGCRKVLTSLRLVALLVTTGSCVRNGLTRSAIDCRKCSSCPRLVPKMVNSKLVRVGNAAPALLQQRRSTQSREGDQPHTHTHTHTHTQAKMHAERLHQLHTPLGWREQDNYIGETTIMENQMEKQMENEMETL